MALTKITGEGYGVGTIITDDNNATLTLKSTDADGSVGPVLDLVRDSASPADGDAIGQIKHIADNDAGEATTYSSAFTTLRDASDGAEDGQTIHYVIAGGALVDHLRMGRGSAGGQSEVVINEGSADIDFRVESNGNANMIFVDGGNDRVGIGASAPAHNFQVGEGSGQMALGNATSGNGASRLAFNSSVSQKNWQVSTNNQISGAFEISQSSSGGNTTYTGTPAFYLNNSGNLVLAGSISKGSGSFKIPHPLEAKKDSHNLVHSFVEGPQADNLYRGKVALVDGTATQNIDTVAGMTEGTFAALNREVQCFTTNETGWTAVKGSVSGNVLTITAQENTCTDTISWMVIGERKDPHMYDTDWTDDDGKVIVEPEVGSGADAPGPGAGS